MVHFIEATAKDASLVIDLIAEMQSEIGEVTTDKSVYVTAITQSFFENVHWFLFYDENEDVPFGTCYMQSVHNYWRVEKRFYLGGFYISPRYQGNGRFKKLYVLLKKWVSDNGGSQIHVHIHQRNAKSLGAFKAVGLEEIEYKLLADHWGE